MAQNDKRLIVSEFDFDDVKDNLKTFLQAQTEFTDYNFEGSALSTLLDVLAYNTHYLGFNMNMLANEMFLDSSSLRSSVVSHAKTLGYETISARAPKATIDVTLFDSVLATATISAGTIFTSTLDDVAYQFVTVNDFTASNIGNQIPFNDVPIYEGTFVTTRYTVDTADVDQRFLIPNDRADTTTLTVKVQTSSTDSTTTTYTKTTDISQVTATSSNYFLQEVEAEKYEVYFGDGVIGQSLSNGNIVILTYVVTNKTAANTASVFTNATAIATVTDVQVSTVLEASGGAEPETIESIKYNAPLDYASQGRCVTAEDYKTFVKRYYPNTQAVSIWGGESGSFDPSLGVVATKEYGRVFISVKSTTGLNLTTSEKTQLVNDLRPFTVASVTPVIVDPDTLYLVLNVSAKYNSSKTTETADSIETLITNTLTDYNNSNLKEFNKMFRHSQVTGLIDNTENSIVSNVTRVVMAKFFTPTTDGSYGYTCSFNNAFYHPHSGHNADSGGIIASTGFYISGDTVNEMFFDDDGAGNLRRYYVAAGVKQYEDNIAGVIDYISGTITINSIYINSISDVDNSTSTQIRLTAVPDSNDIVPVRNQLIELDLTNTTVSALIDGIATGQSGSAAQTVAAGGTYQATSAYTTTPSSY